MRNFAIVLALVISACTAAPAAVELPTPLYADGASFSLPCQEHGSHSLTIQSHSVGVMYSVIDDQGNVQQVPEFIITEVFGVEESPAGGDVSNR